ncbi:uncharacterized protein LOC6051478 [Culex quinquefasciatus]|uniref:uncharacterized protein LOC6051478 n=1 Tax=Culex quinquefasciatus TaxID=7176 RepID=UPI0018E2D50A|nr:uncharacterized protein LOC6051478 [Culex quinquefasciatus]
MFVCILPSVISVLLTIWLVRLIFKHESDPIFEIYRKPGKLYCFKYMLMLALLFLRKAKSKKNHDLQSESEIHKAIEKPQPLSKSIHAIDAVYFNGSNSKMSWLVCGTARRPNKLVNGFLYLKIQEFSDKLLVSPRLPDTCMRQTDFEVGSYSVEGLKITPLKPMQQWRVEYDGAMRFENDYSHNMEVKLQATWTTALPYFNFASDMDPRPTARAMAKEKWSRDHFRNLKKYHQTHYEHFGTLNGIVLINGIEFPLSLDCMRDHSFGEQRNWKNFHRYVMHFVHLENGDCITVGVICMPVTFSSLEVGFVSISHEKCNYAVTNVEFDLYQFGENGKPPVDYAFNFYTGNKRYSVKVIAVACPEFYIGEESECRIVEQHCRFEVNGLTGWGAAEWQYRHLDGLPVPMENK